MSPGTVRASWRPIATATASIVLLVATQGCVGLTAGTAPPAASATPASSTAGTDRPSPTPEATVSTATPTPATSASLPPPATPRPTPQRSPTTPPTESPSVVAYQTPDNFLKLDWSIDPTAAGAGFSLTEGMNGYKVLAVREKLGLTVDGAKSTVDAPMIREVKAYQQAHGLDVDGIVGPRTWAAMGFRADQWTSLDAYVAALRTSASMSRAEHLEAMIAEAMRYEGSQYVWGGANHPDHGADCSGMVLQAMYAIGLDPVPIDMVKHALPAYRTSQELYAHPKLMHVPLAERERGDLVFYGHDGGRGAIYHVAIYLGDGMMVEETPPQGRVTTVRTANLKPTVVRLLP